VHCLNGFKINGKLILTLDKFLSNVSAMQAISYSEARENLKSVIDQVVASRAPIAITRQRGEGAVLVSASEWASIEETFYLLRSPANAARLLEATKGLDAGEGEEHEIGNP
jgi:antitoxin YefM